VQGRGTICGTGRHATVNSWFAHFGEEDCLTGTRGSGTVFFSSCNLRCVFCQNATISQGGGGRELDAEALARAMLDLQRQDCHNLNLVTPSHVVPQILEALCVAIDRGFDLPLVYNTSGYDSAEILALLDGVVDIYMPDFKFWSQARALDLLTAEDYPEVVRQAVREMHRQVGPLRLDDSGLALRGVLVRHLVVPGCSREARAIFEFLARELGPDCYVNVMAQYRPEHRAAEFDDISRSVSLSDLQQAFEAFRDAGLHRCDQRRLRLVPFV
jgi:putative pyruvate formate lyase activating enzyme